MDYVLSGIRVLDLGRLLPHEIPCLILADLGAEVIKIEEPHIGDHMRTVGPPKEKDSYVFLLANRNKKSVTVDLRKEEGQRILHKLVQKSDILFHSFRPSVISRYGLEYEQLSKINPKLIYCTATGYGQTGPFRDLPGHDLNYIATSGVLWTMGRWTGKPVIPGIPIADMTIGIFSALAIITALLWRERTGEGQFIDLSMTDCMAFYNMLHTAKYFSGRSDDAQDILGIECIRPESPAYNVYPTKDGGFIALGCYETKFWINFCNAIGKPEFHEDQWATDDRGKEVVRQVSEIMRTKTRDEWVEILTKVDTCFSPINSVAEAIASEQLNCRQMYFTTKHPVEGDIWQIRLPIHFSNIQLRDQGRPPLLGEYTEVLLREVGLSDEEINQLRKDNVI